ncbi:PTS sugar transporter subunit IIA [Bacillus sp. 2205SS5-2]|uniref:PTS sugar transporter subunit IIA n=1 Tax=Bacillus sp. 2205SS5-2 TaxID=3109031 RepID=UPI003007C9C4
MFKKLFGSKEKPIVSVEFMSPLNGDCLSLTEVPDPVFSQKMMGDGVAILPSEGKVVSPVEGEVIQVFPTKHAIGLKAKNGAEILIHIGLETVSMNGEGFETFVEQGDSVEVGDVLVEFDMNLVNEKAKSTISPIIITNGDQVEIKLKASGEYSVRAGETPLLTLTNKS